MFPSQSVWTEDLSSYSEFLPLAAGQCYSYVLPLQTSDLTFASNKAE